MTRLLHTCFDPLLDGEATERPLGAMIDEEWTDAAINGLEAAVLTVAVLLWQGTPLLLVGMAALGAILLGALLHQVVLIVGVFLLRAWDGAEPTDGGAV